MQQILLGFALLPIKSMLCRFLVTRAASSCMLPASYIIILAGRACSGLKYKLAKDSDIKLPMRMKDFHCGTFELSFDIGAKEIRTDALIKAVGGESQEEIDLFLIFDSKENPGAQHSHVGIQSQADNKVGVRISYHDSQGKADDDKPPYMEDCAKWLSKFIKPDKVKATINATYFFDKGYAPRMKLPYSLRVAGKGLEGGVVTGLSIQFPADSQLDYAIIQRSRDESVKEFAMSISKSEEIAVKTLDLYAELKRLEAPLTTLVKKRAGSHEKRDEK